MRNKSVGVGVANINSIVKDVIKSIMLVIMMSEKNWIRLKILGYIVLCLFFIASFLYFDGEKFIQGCNLFCAIASMNFAYDYRKELVR